jgi:hypothetical protein
VPLLASSCCVYLKVRPKMARNVSHFSLICVPPAVVLRNKQQCRRYDEFMISERSKHHEEQEKMVTASSAQTTRRVVRRRNASLLQHKIIQVLSISFALSVVYIALSKGISSLSQPLQRQGHLRGRKVWVHSNSQLFVSCM